MSKDPTKHTSESVESTTEGQVFYLFRHAETDWNVIRRLQGHSDIDLNSNGENQAKNLRTRLGSITFDRIISSDLVRARRTAEMGVLAAHQPANMIITTSELREVHLGEAEGRQREELIALYGEDFWTRWSSHSAESLDLKFPGGESKREMLLRLLTGLHKYLDTHSGLRLGFVSHGLALRTLCHYLHPELTETHFISNCGALKFERNQSDRSLRMLKYFSSEELIS